MEEYVHLSNGKMFKIFTEGNFKYYIDDTTRRKKVRKNQHLIWCLPNDVEKPAAGPLYGYTDTDLYRVPLPPLQDIWNHNKKIDKYSGFTQGKTEKLTFSDISSIVTRYHDFTVERAIRVERDHIVEVQVVSHVWDQVNEGRRTTRANTTVIRNNVNKLPNLNCTPGVVNMKKKDAIKKFIQSYTTEDGKGLRDHLLDYGFRPNTTHNICKTFEAAAHELADGIQTEGSNKVFDDFSDKITSLMGHIKLE